MLAAAVASVSLILAALVAVRVVPYLARRTALDRWMIKLEYEFTRQGAVYLALVAVIAIAALNTGNNLLFIILAWLLAGIVASGIVSADDPCRAGVGDQASRARLSRPTCRSPVATKKPQTVFCLVFAECIA